MNKSKHFRKDVIIARIIAGVILIILIGLIVFGISLLTKTSDSDKNSQNTENLQNERPEDQNSESIADTEEEVTEDTESEIIEPEPDVAEKVYVKTTAQLNLRKEPNTSCEILEKIPTDTKIEVIENLNGWYKVIYNGEEGYVSATYVKIVEE